jgi:predicted DNA binding CopG/RHH family protein
MLPLTRLQQIDDWKERNQYMYCDICSVDHDDEEENDMWNDIEDYDDSYAKDLDREERLEEVSVLLGVVIRMLREIQDGE